MMGSRRQPSPRTCVRCQRRAVPDQQWVSLLHAYPSSVMRRWYCSAACRDAPVRGRAERAWHPRRIGWCGVRPQVAA